MYDKPLPDDDEPVKQVSLRELGQRTNEARPTPPPQKRQRVYFSIAQFATEPEIQISKQIVTEFPLKEKRQLAKFTFYDHVNLVPDHVYTVLFFEDGLTRIAQIFKVLAPAKMGWLRAEFCRPGARSSRVWVEVRSETSAVLGVSTKLLVGRG